MRQPRDLEELLTLSEEQDITLHGQANRRDLSDPDDRFFLRIEVAHACASITPASAPAPAPFGRRELATLSFAEAGIIGLFQTLALLAGISRSGVTMAAGSAARSSHEDAAKFSFLLATPVILAAGVYKVPSLTGPAGAHIHGQIIVGFLTAGVAAYISVKFLTRYFTTRTLTPFAIYCLVGGAISIGWFSTH